MKLYQLYRGSICEHKGKKAPAYILYADCLAALSKIEKRLPPCPPCDIGENTECICHEPLVPKAWMDAAIAERDASPAQTVNQKLVEALVQAREDLGNLRSTIYRESDGKGLTGPQIDLVLHWMGVALEGHDRANRVLQALATLPADKEKL